MPDTTQPCMVIDETISCSLRQCCSLCRINAQMIHEMIDEGIISPAAGDNPQNWCFGASEIKRIQITLRLQQDLRVNLPGAALALDLLDKLMELQSRNENT
ncbi:MAG: MerR family transcriptional regulator [Desulfobulbaceae bacterium]|jgi:chaperone modulatory protein CbpM|nr:MerR family transcriptional regulator [Desulfobulbaceae bacterium]